MMKFRQTLNLSLTVPLAALALAACQPAQLIAQNQDAPTAVNQVQAPAVLPAGTLNGMVAAFNGTKFVPVDNAEVKVEGTNFIAHTNAEGRYTISGVAPGSYKVTASKDGMVSGTHEIYMNSVMGTPRVNVALQTPQRTLQAVPAPATVTVSGVVTDPRGSALGGATVKVLCNVGGTNNGGFNSTRDVQGGIIADAAGFYTVQIPSVSVSPTQPGQVQVTSWGTSPGGVKLETTDVYAYNLTSTTLVANPQCKAFTQPGTPTWPNGSFGNMGTTTNIKADWLSSRTDEFYIELQSTGSNPNGASNNWVYGVLPDSVANTPAAGTTNPFGVATFRIPFTIPTPTFKARIIPFGLAGQFGAASANNGNPTVNPFVTNYVLGDNATPGTFEYDVTYAAPSAANTTSHAGTLNNTLFVSADTATVIMHLLNSNTAVSQDIQIAGTAPVGSSGLTASYIATTNAVAAAPVNIPAGSITGPDGTGKFTVAGFNMPLQVGANPGKIDLTMNFTSPFGMAKAFSWALSGLSCKMVSANLTKATAPSAPAGITAANIDTTNIAIAKNAFTDAGAPNDGVGFVNLTVTPTGANAAGAIRITDRTFTNSPVGTNATITGTAVLPAAGTTMGFTNGDHIDITTDAGSTSTTILSNWDLETLAAFINVSNTNVTANRDASNHFTIKRTAQGTLKTIQIANTSSASVATKLGVTLGSTVAGTNGASADFTVGVGMASAAMGGGTTYTFANTSSVQNADGSVTASFTLVPPPQAAFSGADTFTTPIVVKYRIIQGGGASLTLGNGQAAPFGASITAVNTSSNVSDMTKDQPVTKAVSDAAAVPNL